MRELQYDFHLLMDLRNSLHENPGLWGRSGVVRGSFGSRWEPGQEAFGVVRRGVGGGGSLGRALVPWGVIWNPKHHFLIFDQG